jgi:4-amino-4-deoxy-L-arabinose transferase-like glycosyltransferase
VSRFWRVLLAICALAFGIRVAYVAIAKAGPCTIVLADGTRAGSSPSSCERGDELFYNAEANSLAQGHGFDEPLVALTRPGDKAGPAADHPPLTVMVLAPVSWLTDHPPVSWFVHEPLHDHVREHRYAMVVLGTLVVLLVGLLGRRVGGDTVGLVAAGIAAVNPEMWVNDGLVMSETLTVLTIVATLLAVLWWRDRPSRWRAAVAGLACGVATLARVEWLLLLPLLVVVTAFVLPQPRAERWRQAAVAVTAAVLVLAPWVGFNLARFHEPTFVSTNDGLTLAGANCADVYHGPAIGFWTLACTGGTQPGDQSQVSSELRRRGLGYARAHASRVPVVVLARIGRTWSLYRPGDMVHLNEGEDREPWATRLGLAAYYPMLLLAIAGGVELWRRRTARALLWALAVPLVIVTVNTAATYGQTRFRAGAEPSLVLLGAVGLVALVRRVRTPEPAAELAPVR